MRKITSLYKKIQENNFTSLSGLISFFVLINGGSFFFLIITLLRFVNLDYFNNFISFFPNGSIKDLISYLYNYIYGLNISYPIIFIITSLWSSSSLIYHVLKLGEIIYSERRKDPFRLFNRIMAILFVFISLFF